jgi:hypothetical protein
MARWMGKSFYTKPKKIDKFWFLFNNYTIAPNYIFLMSELNITLLILGIVAIVVIALFLEFNIYNKTNLKTGEVDTELRKPITK